MLTHTEAVFYDVLGLSEHLYHITNNIPGFFKKIPAGFHHFSPFASHDARVHHRADCRTYYASDYDALCKTVVHYFRLLCF